jgi:hypothetical protein
MNAMQFGLFARTRRLLSDECEHQYALLCAGVFQQLNPVGVLEESECWAIVQLLQRRQRSERFEFAAINHGRKLHNAAAKQMRRPGPAIPVIPNAQTLRGLSALPKMDGLEKLFTCEAHVSRQLDKCYRRLERLQQRRCDNENLKTNLGGSIPRPRIFID